MFFNDVRFWFRGVYMTQEFNEFRLFNRNSKCWVGLDFFFSRFELGCVFGKPKKSIRFEG